jgi:predicted metalloendopeptidase
LYLKEIKPGIIDGFTTEQRFFLFWAPFELNHVEAKKPSETDPHSPGIYHLCSSKILMPYERHRTQKGTYIEPGKRVRIWQLAEHLNANPNLDL